ncbi:DNA polymerase I, partial [Candidatus Saccharibacteria bacterium]|nr:DNA polymerase I [Candidatus Saccharibacteria bacterium]
MKRKKLVIFDGHALVHRGFHAIPYLTTKDGTPTNAVYGFTMMMLLALRELKPDYAIVAWDAPGKTFRHDQFADYKATRKKAPDELYAQMPLTKKVVEAFSIPLIEAPGFEADDVIGTLTTKYGKTHDVVVVTGDMDELQLVTDHVGVYTMRKGFTDTFLYTPKEVFDKYGVTPEEFIVYKALKGDTSDNIPGVAGVGDKGATALVAEYKTLDVMYQNLDVIKPALAKKLEASKDNAYLSLDLSRIKCDVEFVFDLKDSALHEYDRKKVFDLFHELEFKSLLSKLPGQIVSDEPQTNLLEEQAVEQAEKFNRDHLKTAKYHSVTTKQELTTLVELLMSQPTISVDTETTSVDVIEARLVGISLSCKEGEAYYIPVGHTSTPADIPFDQSSLLADVSPELELADGQLDKQYVLDQLKSVLENPKIGKIGHNIKYDYQIFNRAGIDLKPIAFDTMVGVFLINPIGRAQSLSELAYGELGISMIDITELIGKKGKNQQTFNVISIEQATQYAAEDADIAWRLYKKIVQQLQTEPTGTKKMSKMASELEWPLIEVLGDMELTGVSLDVKFLQKLSDEFTKKLNNLQKSIWKYAGREFNISSTQQLKVVLFDELKIDITGLKKIKTGVSTAASELEKLKGKSPIIDLLFEYRELSKLISTYVDALPQLVARDGKIHTSYNQTIAQTGRLSSTNPNLQNIPVRTEVGKQIRKAFVSDPGNLFVSADYSQIELRLAAALADDKPMIKSFQEGADIHVATSAEMFGIKPSEVTAEQRYAAKAINFGVLYGMNTHGLSVATGFDYAQSKDFIDRYFTLRRGVADYIASIKKMAHDKGYTETIFGRRRPCPDVLSSNFLVRSAAERAAVNMPLQGTAADMMKLAMVRIHKVLPDGAKLILQIHDELIVECTE